MGRFLIQGTKNERNVKLNFFPPLEEEQKSREMENLEKVGDPFEYIARLQSSTIHASTIPSCIIKVQAGPRDASTQIHQEMHYFFNIIVARYHGSFTGRKL
jgi:hypothetical protein